MVPSGSDAEQHHFDVYKERLRGNGCLWQGDKGLDAAAKEFCSVGRPMVVSLVGQLAKLRSRSEDDFDDSIVSSHELMTRLSEAGEAIRNTLFTALVINGWDT